MVETRYLERFHIFPPTTAIILSKVKVSLPLTHSVCDFNSNQYKKNIL